MREACQGRHDQIHLYVDGELSTEDQLAFELHLLECEVCRIEHDQVREVVDIVRGSKPLYPVSPKLPESVRSILAVPRKPSVSRRAALMTGSFAATLALLALLPNFHPASFTSFAAETHLDYARHALSLGVASSTPGVVSDWLKAHLPLDLKLADLPAELGEPRSYALVGAQRMRFNGDDVAFLAYQLDSRPVSLLVTSAEQLAPPEAEVFTSGKLSFHFSTEKGLKLITWRDRGLSYALVSDTQVVAAQSCVVCHSSGPDRKKFEKLLRLEH